MVFKRILFCAVLSVCILAGAGAQQPVKADYKIEGRLVDANSQQPIAHARVAVAPVTERNEFTTIVTGEDGLFSFTGLKPGKYNLTAQARGYVVQSFNQHDQYSSSIVVGESLNSGGLIFRLAKENSIDGTVIDEGGEPVRNAQIALYQTGTAGGSQGTRVRSHAMTNDEGNYHIGHLQDGDYMVSVFAQVWYARRPGVRRIYKSRSGSISQSFGFTSGRNGAEAAGYTFTDEPEPPSPLDLAYPVTFFPGVTDPGSASLIHLKRGEKYVADFNLQPVRALHLKLPGPDSPETQMNYRLEQKMIDGTAIPIPSQSQRLPSGEFEINGIAPGRYVLISESFTPPQPGAHGGVNRELKSTREIEALGNGEFADGKTSAPAQVKAKLQFDPGASVASRSFLQLFDFKTRRNIYEQISENGEIEFKEPVRPGTYEVSINGNGSSYIRSIVATGARAYGRSVVIRGSAPVNLEIAIGKGQGQITGTALKNGQPLAGVMIVAVPADPVHNQVLFRRDQSDSDGTFTLPNVVPGDYTVLALENGWDLQWLKAEVLKPYMAQGEAMQVKQNGKYELKLKVQ